jgi:hypothetical protein
MQNNKLVAGLVTAAVLTWGFALIATFCSCATQPATPPQAAENVTENSDDAESEMVRMADGTCVQVMPSWNVIEAGRKVRLSRDGIGRIKILPVFQAETALEQMSLQQNRSDLDGNMVFNDCAPGNCAVSYLSNEENGTPTRIYVYLADRNHLLYLTVPHQSRNQQFAVSEAMRFLQNFGRCH